MSMEEIILHPVPMHNDAVSITNEGFSKAETSADERVDEGNVQSVAASEKRSRCCYLYWPQVSRILAVAVLGLMLWGGAVSKLGSMASPQGQLFQIGALAITAYLAGWLISFLQLPSLLGMMLAGIALRNVGFVVLTGGYLHVAATLRQMALVVILLRAGLELDPSALKRLGTMVLRLAIGPAVVEAVAVAVFAYFLLDLPWIWGFLLGAVLAAVSPEVVIPLLCNLQTKGSYGKAKGIPTIVIAAASFDDIVAISAFGVLLNIATSTGDLKTTIIRCPVGLAIGSLCGLAIGLFLRYVPYQDDTRVTMLRTLLLAAGGMFLMFGSATIGYEGAGPLACIITSFVASNGWRLTGKQAAERNFELLYTIIQPIQFGLIGIEINLFVLEGRMVGLGVVSLLASLAVRIAASIVVAAGGNLNWKEKFFVSFAWFPKATVQAAIGPVALDEVRKMQLEEYEAYATTVLIIAVLSILITAPVGAILITVLGTRLLEKEEQ